MEPFNYHVFVCDQVKAEGAPCCSARGSGKVIEALRREIAARNLEDEVQVTTCGSLGLCEWGPNMIVYPEGVWYAGVQPEDVPEIVRSHFEENTPVERLARMDASAVRAEILANREKRLAAMRAREQAGALPDEWNDKIRSFQECRAILTALELDLFTALGEGSTAAAAAAKTETNARALEMLLNALAAIGLVTKRDGVFHSAAVAQRYFTARSPDNAQPALMHIVHLWERWSTLTEAVRTGTSVTEREIGASGEDWVQAFIAAMHRNASERARVLTRVVGAERLRRMLDVGGGSGAYSIAFANANPELRCDILDLAEVAPIAQGHIERAGVGDRVRVRVGDLRSGQLGEGYDLVLISQICHMLDEAENLDLVRRSHAALATGGQIAIQDFILEPDKTAPKWAALFALNMLVGTRAGNTYSEAEYAGWLAQAGFKEIRRVRIPGPACLMLATA